VTRFVAVPVVALTILAGGAARAQEPEGEGGRAPEGRRAEAFRMVDAYVVSNLQESLGLTDTEFVKVLPLVKKLQTGRREHLLERGRLLRQLRQQLRSGTASEAAVRETLDRLKAVEGRGAERTRADLVELDAALTPLQQAKYRVMELEVELRMRELTNRARARRAPRE
jgi:hypothetical protein